MGEQIRLATHNVRQPMICPSLVTSEGLNGFALSTRFLPLLVDHGRELSNAAPSVRPHYRAFNPTASCSVPVPRIGTLALMGASHLSVFLGIGATGSHVPCKSQPQSHAAFMPDAVRAAIRPPPGLLPGQRLLPGFDIAYTLSTRPQRFAHARLSEPYLTESSSAFSATLTTTALDRRSLRWFGACP